MGDVAAFANYSHILMHELRAQTQSILFSYSIYSYTHTAHNTRYNSFNMELQHKYVCRCRMCIVYTVHMSERYTTFTIYSPHLKFNLNNRIQSCGIIFYRIKPKKVTSTSATSYKFWSCSKASNYTSFVYLFLCF